MIFQIIEVEHSLRKCGKLKSISDIKEFWEQMLAPLQTPAITILPASSRTSTAELEQALQEEDCTNSWAITASTPDANKVSIIEYFQLLTVYCYSKRDVQLVLPQHLLH